MGSSMLLPPLTTGLAEYHQGIADALADPLAKIYVDTSMLMWLLKIGRSARLEFLTWCRTPALSARIFVPVWSVHELYHHLQKRTVPVEDKDNIGRYESSLRALVEYADTVGDDSLCVSSIFTSRIDLLENLRRLGIEISTCVRALQNTATVYDQAVTDLTSFVNERSLGTDVFDLLMKDGNNFISRFEGRVPPGYKDGHKTDNAFGDLVFWSEVLEHGEGSSCVVILTRDEKTDWRHSPSNILNYQGVLKSNKFVPGAEIQLPHPMLDFEAKLSGISDLKVVNATILACVLHRFYGGTTPLLMAAAFPRPFLDQNERPNWRGMGIVLARAQTGAVETEQVPEVAATSDRVPISGIQLSDLETGFPRNILAPYRELFAASPPGLSGNEAGGLLSPEVLATFDTYSLIELGHAAMTSSENNPGRMSSAELLAISASVSADAEGAVLLGMLLAVYLDSGLQPRQGPLTDLAQPVLLKACGEAFSSVREKLVDLLTLKSCWFLVSPADWSSPVPFEVRLVATGNGKQKRIESITVKDIELLDDAASEERRFLSFLGSPEVPLQELLKLVSMQFAIPFQLLSVEYDRTSPVVWHDDAGLVRMRIDEGDVFTNVQSSFIDEESEEEERDHE